MLTMQKYHGIGNDYLVLDPNKNELKLTEGQIHLICRRNFGIGADGVLYGPIMEDGKIYVRIFNPDGSEAERSGNGIRIFSKYLWDAGYVHEKKFSLFTKAGEVEVEFLNDLGDEMRVKMGKPVFACSRIPVKGMEEEIVNVPLLFHGELYNATCVSIGNPNCVIMMEDVSGTKAKALGPYVENAAYFPNRINMQLCHVLDKNHIEVEIYERGAGYTLASGTGACAAASAAYRLGLVEGKIHVKMPGGELFIEIEEDFTIYMTGTVCAVGTFLVAEHFFA